MNILKELIEKAKQEAKENFLGFVKGIYKIDECVFEHLWNEPVVAIYEELYNESNLQKKYEEFYNSNLKSTQPKTQEELDKYFVNYLKEIITRERCYLNANYYNTENIQLKADIFDYRNQKEILVDILSKMMNNYQEGYSIEDCLHKIIKDKISEANYDDIDYKEVLAMYILFPQELTEWVTFGAYNLVIENKLQKMLIRVFRNRYSN